jgi:hypothetical protein
MFSEPRSNFTADESTKPEQSGPSSRDVVHAFAKVHQVLYWSGRVHLFDLSMVRDVLHYLTLRIRLVRYLRDHAASVKAIMRSSHYI